MSVNIESTAKFPMAADDWVKTILIGGVLVLLSFLILPAFLVYGYFVEVLRTGMRDDSEPPAFENWGKLFREGVLAFVIALVYQLVPIIVFGVTIGGSMLAMATGSNAGAGLGIAGIAGGFLLTFVLALVFGYVGLIGVANYAHEGRFGAAFDFGVIKTVATNGDYAVLWLYGVAFVLAAGIVASLLGAIPILGAIIGVFVVFYGQIIGGTLWGRGYATAMGHSFTEPAATEPPV